MAFLGKFGGILKQSVTKQIQLHSKPSISQSLRWMSSSKVFIGGLSYSTDEASMQEAFSQYGTVVDARVIVDRESGRSKGFGFVTFTSSEEASSAIQALDGQDLHGRIVKVAYAIDRARSYGGDAGYGGNTGGGYGGDAGYGGNTGSGYAAGGAYRGNNAGGDGYGGNNSGGYGAGGAYGGNNAGQDGYGGNSGGGYGTGGYGNASHGGNYSGDGVSGGGYGSSDQVGVNNGYVSGGAYNGGEQSSTKAQPGWE